MVQAQPKMPAPPQGVVAALVAGFEAVNARLELTLLPLALDLFLWLGPHASIRPLMATLAVAVASLPTMGQPDAVENVKAVQAVVADAGARYNVFAVLSTFPLGLPSLAAGRLPVETPIGVPVMWAISEWGLYLGLLVGCALLGLLLGAVYFEGIAQQVRDRQVQPRLLLQRMWGDWARMIGLAALALGLLVALGLPALFISVIVAQLNLVLGSLVSILASTVLLWVLFYGGFALHAMLLQRRGLWGALWDSARLVQASLPQAAGLFVVIVIVNSGLNWVWGIPNDRSWLLLLGLAGHALISTGLVAATFVFYQDRSRWLTEMRQALLAHAEAERKRAGHQAGAPDGR